MISLKWIIVIGVTPQWFFVPICTDSNPTGNTHQHRVVLSIFFPLERNCFNMHFIANEVEYFFHVFTDHLFFFCELFIPFAYFSELIFF